MHHDLLLAADPGGETWNWVNLVAMVLVGVGGVLLTLWMGRAGEDRKAVWDAIKDIRQDNEDCNRERGTQEARHQALEVRVQAVERHHAGDD